MTTEITEHSGRQAYHLIYHEHFAKLPLIEQDAMLRTMLNSSRCYIATIDGVFVAVWGLIPPTLLSDRAYLWLWTTKHMTSHSFCLIRHSQRMIQSILHDYPIIIGHGEIGNDRSLRWLRWLGAQFGEPVGKFLPFEIRASQWHQASELSA